MHIHKAFCIGLCTPLLLLASCTDTIRTDPQADTYLNQLRDGSVTLEKKEPKDAPSDLSLTLLVDLRTNIKLPNNAEDLAITVIKWNYDSDLMWFLLGEAAHEKSLKDPAYAEPALTYYKKSLEENRGQDRARQCRNLRGDPKLNMDQCAFIKLPQEINAGIRSLQSK